MATVYVRNLNEKTPLDGLKGDLKTKFQGFGDVFGVCAKKSLKMRGQAFVDFRDPADAQRAIEALNNTEMHGKTIKVALAKSDSDAVHLLKTGAPKKRKLTADDQQQSLRQKRQKFPNKILFLENLPDNVTVEQLNSRFDSNEGFVEARIFALRGVGFIEFDTIENADKSLGDFELGGNTVTVSFAK